MPDLDNWRCRNSVLMPLMAL